MVDVERGLPPIEKSLALLNSAFDEWGDSRYYRWRYHAYPGFDASDHVFYKTSNDRVIAHRRLYEKELCCGSTGKRIKGFLLGDGAVEENYRGRGHYSDLHAATQRFCLEQGADVLLAYNSKENLTYKANQRRGFECRPVPLWVNVLSPGAVIKRYAQRVTGVSRLAGRLPSAVTDRVGIRLHDGTVTVTEILNGKPANGVDPVVWLEPDESAIDELIEGVSNRDRLKTFRSVGKVALSTVLPYKRDVKEFGQEDGPTGNAERTDRLTPSEVSEVCSLYQERFAEGTVSFSRTAAEIDHMTSYPDCDVVVTREDGVISGFAVVGPKRNDTVTEGRILDVVYRKETDFDVLLATIRRVSREKGYDLLVGALEKRPGEDWIEIDKQVLMCKPISEEGSRAGVSSSEIRVSLYDV
ncbi:hypothetical protein [Natronorarus salvus]|uniref:hypothetical protein n=1 Tax=Natronorarus salvus TaxID=3117733 RepID=UPI002F26AE62